MSSFRCREGLQSCLEPGCVEGPLFLKVKSAGPASPSSNNYVSDSFPTNSNPFRTESCDNLAATAEKDKVGIDSWSFLQCLTMGNRSQETQFNQKDDDAYVPRSAVNRSPSTLSEKSLELCTESLGSETGTDKSMSDDDILACVHPQINMSASDAEPAVTLAPWERSNLRELNKRSNRFKAHFPPPLTSVVSSPTAVRVRSYREDGRLVLKAETQSTIEALFHAERVDGRLRLHWKKKSCFLLQGDMEEEEEENEEEEKWVGQRDGDVVGDGADFCDDEYWERQKNNETPSAPHVSISGNMGWPSRCNDGGAGIGTGDMLKPEPFWLAT